MKITRLLVIAVLAHSAICLAAAHRVDVDLKSYDDQVTVLNKAFDSLPANPKDKGWVNSKLAHMVEVDQYARNYLQTPFKQHYEDGERKEFNLKFIPRLQAIDLEDTRDLKELLKLYRWFVKSEFGIAGDRNAWLLVQHADQDPAFQRDILIILSTFYKSGETSPSNYAYLFDRVASSFSDPSKKVFQRYGTQGHCTGPGTWEPLPSEDPANLDARRKEVGLGTEADYIKMFKDICHGRQ